MIGRMQVTLQTKILGLVLFLIVLVLGGLTAMFAYNETNEDVEQAEHLALQTAQTLSFMPAVQETFSTDSNKQSLDLVVNKMLNQVNASGIFVENRNGQVISSAGVEGENSVTDFRDTYKALVFASSYIVHVGEGEEEVLKGISPVVLDYGEYTKVEGAVIVEFNMSEIHSHIGKEIKKMLSTAGLVLLIGILGSVLLARNIRKDTLGLEPYEIASLYRERNAILQSVKEGIVAVDQYGSVTMMNKSAQNILDVTHSIEGQKIRDIITSDEIIRLLESNKDESNQELQYKEKTVIVNTKPVLEDGSRVGTVASFRDKTEMKKMIEAFSEVKKYSEDLRAQAHEFTNKLYVIFGLIQLGKKEEVIQFIQEETKTHEHQTEMIFNRIKDEKIQAILLGKLAKASEKKINFTIDQGSSLSPLSNAFELSPLIVILGNILDNAFDAAAESEEKQVSFFVTDFGNDILFEVTDSGRGILKDQEELIFKKGFSHKGDKRGYGLANVKEEVEHLEGSIELTSAENGGTVFSVFLPKERQ